MIDWQRVTAEGYPALLEVVQALADALDAQGVDVQVSPRFSVGRTPVLESSQAAQDEPGEAQRAEAVGFDVQPRNTRSSGILREL